MGKIIERLLSRFLVPKISECTFEEFREIVISRLTKVKVDNYIASVIVEYKFGMNYVRDIRDVLMLGRLTSSITGIPFIVKMMARDESP
jgi:hypothetical protein